MGYLNLKKKSQSFKIISVKMNTVKEMYRNWENQICYVTNIKYGVY